MLFRSAASFPEAVFYIVEKRKEVAVLPIINLSLQVLPKVPDKDTYAVVDEAIKVIQESGLKHIVGPLDTTMEGELDECWAVAKKAQEACIRAGASRVMSIIKIDYCPTGVTMEEKIGKYR